LKDGPILRDDFTTNGHRILSTSLQAFEKQSFHWR
jgi:hypothetical protein